MDISTLNIWAVLVAAIAGHLVGAIWYSPVLFSNAWMDAIGKKADEFEKVNMGGLLATTFVFQLIMAFCLGMFLNDPAIGTAEGAFYGFLTGFGWIFFAIATNSLYEQRPFKYTLISGLHWTVVFTVMGLILGYWK